MNNQNGISFPSTRMRRVRRTDALRRLVEETTLSASDLIYPVFLLSGKNQSTPIESMPGINRQSIDGILKTAEKLLKLNIPAITLFPVIAEHKKSITGEEAYNPDGLIQKSIAKLKAEFPELIIITDVALDPYTTHGQDGIIDENNYVLNDATVNILTKQAISHAQAGADIIVVGNVIEKDSELIKEIADAIHTI